jgi:hypothetical protein
MDVLQFSLLLFLPWTINLVILLRQRSHANSSGQPSVFWNRAFAAWVCVLVAFVIPAITWSGDDSNSIDVVRWLVHATAVRVGDALVHVLRYILPFAAYPLVVFWFKLLVDYSVGANGETGEFHDAMHRHQHRMQAQLITFAIKVVVIAFVFFDMITTLGVPSDKVLQMGTIFGIGLSWATTDWLRSLWASFMIAFTTDLTVGSEILIGTPSAGTLDESPDWLSVQEAGLIFTICTPCHKHVGRMDTPNRPTPPTPTPESTGTRRMDQFGFGSIGFGALRLGVTPAVTSSRSANASQKRLSRKTGKAPHYYIPNSSLLHAGFTHRNP